MLEMLSAVIIHLIQTTSYLGVFMLMFLEAALIPIPSEITLPFAGFLAQKGTFILPAVIAAAIIGDTAGTMLLYALGVFLEEELILKTIHKYGKFILFSKNEYDHLVKWFQKYGGLMIIIGKLLPGFRTIIGLPAGLSEEPWLKTLGFTFLGSAIWCAGFTYAGFALGNNWKTLDPIFRKFEIIIAVILIVGVLWYINHKLKIVNLKKSSKN